VEDDSDSEDSLTAIGHVDDDDPLSPTSPPDDDSSSYLSYESLKKSNTLPDGVNSDERENYLSPKDFVKLFNMTKAEFEQLPKWKQLKMKEKLDLY